MIKSCKKFKMKNEEGRIMEITESNRNASQILGKDFPLQSRILTATMIRENRIKIL